MKKTAWWSAGLTLKPSTISDEVRAGGRIPLMIGRALTDKVRAKLGLAPSDLFIRPSAPADTGKGFTLAQKMVGKACGLRWRPTRAPAASR